MPTTSLPFIFVLAKETRDNKELPANAIADLFINVLRELLMANNFK
jgi:hypothetical protein